MLALGSLLKNEVQRRTMVMTQFDEEESRYLVSEEKQRKKKGKFGAGKGEKGPGKRVNGVAGGITGSQDGKDAGGILAREERYRRLQRELLEAEMIVSFFLGPSPWLLRAGSKEAGKEGVNGGTAIPKKRRQRLWCFWSLLKVGKRVRDGERGGSWRGTYEGGRTGRE